jgi:N-acetylglucosaminyl-diphospho-decaprenol L-rhamnosyltransferase
MSEPADLTHPRPDVSVVVVTYNGMPWIERCLESVRGWETIVVDHGSTDGTLELVRERFPELRLIEQANLGMGAGNNAGMRVASGRYFLLLNSDAWVLGDGVERMAAFADEHPEAAVVGPKLLNPDGSLQPSVRGFPTYWRLATEYLFLRKLGPRTRALNAFHGNGFDYRSVLEAEWLSGACLLVRREAADAVGLFDEDFFMFSEEVDWSYRFRRAGWEVLFYPGAEVVHVVGAARNPALHNELLRGHLRFFAKHRGLREAERVRRLLLFATRLRGVVFRGDRARMYREGARWLASGSTASLLERPR